MLSRTLIQYETEAVAWISIMVSILYLPFFGFYVYQTLDGVQDVEDFLLNEPQGQALVVTSARLGVFLAVWIPLAVLLKIAAAKRNCTLLKIWSIFQLLLIFLISLSILIEPPKTCIVILAYIVVFTYFLVTLWICEKLVREIQQSDASKFRRLDIESPNPLAPSSTLVFNNEDMNGNILGSDFHHILDLDDNHNANQVYSVEMKKVLK